MNLDTLIRAMDNPRDVSRERYAQLLPHYEQAMRLADITNVNRAAMFAAQLGHESAGLRYTEEIADGSAYEWRDELGNNQPGDGKRFKGRGPIQVTGRHNYTKLSQWAFDRKIVDRPDYFVINPWRLSEDGYGFLGAVWYWTTQRQLNALSDRRDLVGATRAVNGGTNGLPDRQVRYDRCTALGDALLPSEQDDFMAEREDVMTQLGGNGFKGWPFLGGPSNADPSRDNTLVEAVGEIRDQLGGPDHRWGGWSQLGNRTVVNALAAIGAKLGVDGFKDPGAQA